MTADEIVASVQSHPPHADVLVAPAVRTLVDEVVRLRARLDTRARWLDSTRRAVRHALTQADDDMATLEERLSSREVRTNTALLASAGVLSP